MKVWRVVNNSPKRQNPGYSPNMYEKKTQKYWSEREARKLYRKLINVFGEEFITLEYAELREWTEI